MLDRYDRADRPDIARNREAALAAGLRYAAPYEDPGFTRRRVGKKGFVYHDEHGTKLTRAETLARIRRIVIPPAWTDVWIARDPIGHIQAAGRDARGRLQYRYHDQWRTHRDAAKYDKLAAFCAALPALRTRVERDLACRCICRESVAATVIALLERGHLRVGNDEYVKQNGTYGATTLENRHLRLRGRHIDLHYRGKSGVERHVELDDPALAAVIRKVKELPGKRLFQYVVDGKPRPITSNEVNAYLRDAIGAQFSAKDFRTWAASLSTALQLATLEPPSAERAQKKVVTGVIKEVAARLGHTPTVCRKSYVHPRVIEAWATGDLARTFPPKLRASAARGVDVDDLRAAERYVIALFEPAHTRKTTPRARRVARAVRATGARRPAQGAAASAA